MTIEQLLKIILNDQAYLYALIMELKADGEATPEMFEAWQDEWMELTHEILEGLNETDDPS